MKQIILEHGDFNEIKGILEKVLEEVELIKNKQPLNEKWLDNPEVCNLLYVSKRTLQNYRDNGTLPFSQIGGKIYYKASDIEKVLNKHYVKSRHF